MKSTKPTDRPESTETPGVKERGRRLSVIVVAAIILIGLSSVLVVRHNSTRHVSHETPEANSKQTESELADYKHQVSVYIVHDMILPQTLRIPSDTYVSWINKDSVAHKLAIVPGTYMPPEFDNNHLIVAGDGYPYVIHQAVTFHYFLVDNPKSSATVIVK